MNLNFVKDVVSNLVHEGGEPAFYYRAINDSFNKATGVTTREYTVIKLKKAFLFPLSKAKDFRYDLSFIAANKNFTYGALFDRNHYICVARFKDFKGVTPVMNDQIVQNNERFVIKLITTYAALGAYEFVLESTDGSSKEKYAYADTRIEFRSVASND